MMFNIRSLFKNSIFVLLLAILIQCSLSLEYVSDQTKDDDKNQYKKGDYIGVYIAVFICAFPITFHIFDFVGLFDNIVNRLGNKAYKNFLHENSVHLKTGTITVEEFKHILIEFYKEHNNEKIVNIDEILKLYKGYEQALLDQLQEKYHHPVNVTIKSAESKDVVVEVNTDGSVPTTEEAAADKEKDSTKYETICGREKVLCGRKFPVYEYHGDFKKTLIAGRTYYNTYDGIRGDSCFCLASSLYSDAMFFFFNNHSLFAMCGAINGHPFTRYNRRMAFIVRHSLAFLLSVAFFMLPIPEGEKAAINTMLITPLTIFVNTSYYLIVACPCLAGEISSPTLRNIFLFFQRSASLLAHICCLISIVWVIVAGAVTGKDDKFATLSKYLYEVFVFAILLELALFFLKFFASTFCIKFYIMSTNVFTISDWFSEFVTINRLEPTKRWFGIPVVATIEIWTLPKLEFKQKQSVPTKADNIEMQDIYAKEKDNV